MRGFERQSRAEGNTVAPHQRGAIDVGKTIRIGSGKAAGDLATLENEVQARRRVGVLMHDHFAAPLALMVGIGAGIIEKAVATHDTAIVENDDTGRVAALDAGHLDPERVQSVRNTLPGFGAGRAAGFSRDVQGWGLQAAVPGRAVRHGL
jgi:hypothetical protein